MLTLRLRPTNLSRVRTGGPVLLLATLVSLVVAISGCGEERRTRAKRQKSRTGVAATAVQSSAGVERETQVSTTLESGAARDAARRSRESVEQASLEVLRLTEATERSSRERDRRSSDGGARIRNVVLIVADGLAQDWIGCYGGSIAKTPYIDWLSENGVTFHNAYSMAQPVISQATLLTGVYPNRHGWTGDWDVRDADYGCWFDWSQHPCLVRQPHLSRTASSMVGRWLLNDLRAQPDALLHFGFRRWCVENSTGTEAGLWSPHLHLSSPISREVGGLPNRDSRQSNWGASGTFSERYSPDLFSEFIQVRRSTRRRYPFFVYYAMNLPGNLEPVGDGVRDPGQEYDRYGALVSQTDEAVGALLNWLSSNDELDDTVVIFTSNTGAPVGIHDRANGREIPGGRETLTERGIRVPLIVYSPVGSLSGIETDCLVDFTDIAPSVCQAVAPNWSVSRDYDGHSFWPVILGEDPGGSRDWIMSLGVGSLEYDGERVRGPARFAERVLRDRRFKVHVNTERQIDGLWDLESDSGEQVNLVGSDESEHRRAIEKFERVVAEMPEADAELPYRPLLAPR